MSKNKKQVKKEESDDDLDAFLNEAAAANATVMDSLKPEVNLNAVEDDNEENDAGDKKDKKKRVKKKASEKKTVAPEPKAAPLSAAAKLIQEQQRRLAEEEARLKKIQEEEEARIRAEEEAAEAAQKAEEEAKEKKRRAKEEKKEREKAEGRYMTPAEKKRAKEAEKKRQALIDSGVISADVLNKADGEQTEEKKGGAFMYNTKKKKQVNKGDNSPTPDELAAKKAAEEAAAAAAAAAEEDEIVLMDDWDASDVELDNLDIAIEIEDDAEDKATKEEQARENERLRELGLARARREEEARLQRELEERERAELEEKEREAAYKKEQGRLNRIKREKDAREARTKDRLRSPISCIMGHVDTGKTSLLDKIRHTNVQDGEAGGITQQIGATQFPRETLITQTKPMEKFEEVDVKVPGLLMIDTPGHESFTNLRSRGSSLCDMAILVIDLMHGLEPQTIESINLLTKKNTPFVVALNKVDRCYGWKSVPNRDIRSSLEAQDDNCRYEFKDRTSQVILQLNELGLNAALYWENTSPEDTISLVPTSAVTGEGVPDLLWALVKNCQTTLIENIMYMETLQCTVLEVKAIEGLGHTVDVVLVNGTLREGDTIVVSTLDGPVVTTIRALLTPPPNREMRVRADYIHHQTLSGAIGIKIVATDLGRTLAGTPILVIQEGDDVEDIKEEVQSDLAKIMNTLQTDNRGVMVHASTLGALEALLQFLREECKPPIPVSHVNIGPIHKRDVMRASIMHEKKLPEFATILAFDVNLDNEAKDFAEEMNVRIFQADIIYHLFDQFTTFMSNLQEERKSIAKSVVVFPCVLKILPQFIFNKKDPIVIGVEVTEGTLRLDTPLCIPSIDLDVGRIVSMEVNHKEATVAKKGTQVSVRITNESNPNITYGRQFDHTHSLYSKISRASIDACKEFFKDDLTKDDWQLTVKLKKVFNIA